MLKTVKREHDIHIKLTKKEFGALKAVAEKEYLPTSSLARQLILERLQGRRKK